MKRIFVLAMALFMVACDPLDTGDPPELTDFTVRAVSAGQIEVAWEADKISDDGTEPFTLQVAIWVAPTDSPLDIDNLGAPDFITDEGALSFNIVTIDADGDGTFEDLEHATSYEVLARARARGPDYSINDAPKPVTTTTETGGTFKAGKETVLGSGIRPNRLIGGNVLAATGEELGLISGNTITWYTAAAGDGTFTTDGDPTTPTIGSTINHAFLVPMDAGLDHLLVLTDEELVYYTNSAEGLAVHTSMTFDGTPVAESFSYRTDADSGLLEVFSYIDTGGDLHIYRRPNEDDDEDAPFLEAHSERLDSGTLVSLAKLNGDVFYDLVYLQGNTLYVALAESLDDFPGASEITTLTIDETGGSEMEDIVYAANLFVEKATSTGDYDINLFIRNESDNLSQIITYEGDGEGRFDNAVITPYDYHFYLRPLVVDVLGDNTVDLMVPQTSSNNVAVYTGPDFARNTSPTYYGVKGGNGVIGAPSHALVLNLTTDGKPDMVIYDEGRGVITTLLSE